MNSAKPPRWLKSAFKFIVFEGDLHVGLEVAIYKKQNVYG